MIRRRPSALSVSRTKCMRCEHANPTGHRFCGACGAPLVRRCPACDAALDPTVKFCGECGTSVAPGNATAAAEEGERRQMTVLFADLVGSTELSGRLDPEDYHEVVRTHQRRAEAIVIRHGGHVAAYLGDGILAYFGWPKTYDDAAERAVRAALDLVDDAARIAAGGGTLAVRVGLHTGPVVLRTQGGGAGRTEPVALGEVPNVASRVQTAADPGTVLVSADTLRLVAGLFVVEERGPQTLRGVRNAMTLYRVVRPSGVRSRLGATTGRLTRFVGRDVELATLVERWERAQDGEGHNVLVIGEAGVGKSRLAYQLRERLAAVPHTWLECGATPYTQGTPFHPLIELARQALNFAPGDGPDVKLQRLERGLGKLASPEAVALVAEFLALPAPTALAMSPEEQRRKTIDLMARWNLAHSAIQPIVVVVEDLHWCDASSLEVLGRLVTQSATANVLLLMTARPEFVPPWPARENTTTLRLARLTKRQAREMVTAIGSTHLGAETADALVARADGVPLFIEELTKSVLGPGAVRDAAAIPSTLADSLMARLDRLATGKDVAQRAAVLGRELSYTLLAAVAGMSETTLRRGLARLVKAEILFVRGEPPDATYTFKHALVQEAAYESLLKRARQTMHGRVVDVLLAELPERAAAEPELVARHAEAAGRVTEAVDCYQRAGERAQSRSAHAEAIRHFEHAIAILLTQPESRARDTREAALQVPLAESRTVALGYTSPAVEAAHERTRALCEAVGDELGLGHALSRLGVFAHNSGDTERACLLGAQALAIGERVGDPGLLLKAHCDLGLTEVYRGKFGSSLAHLETALGLAQPDVYRANLFASGNPGVRALSASAWDLFVLGFPDRALTRAREGVIRAQELAHPFSIAHALFFETVVHALRQDGVRQRERATETIALSEAQGFPFWLGVGQAFHAAARVQAGETAAIADLQAGLALMATAGSRGGAPALMVLLGKSYRAAGRLDEARTTITNGLALAAQSAQTFFDAELLRVQAEIHLAAGDEDAAAASYERALAVARSQASKSFELRVAIGLARLAARRGDREAARALLAPVYGWFTEGFDTRDLLDARMLLDDLA